MSTQPVQSDRQYVVREQDVDARMAREATDSTSLFRAALARIMPSGSSIVPRGAMTSVVQASDGSWPNPVRDATQGSRIYFSPLASGRAPAVADGLVVGDVWVSQSVFQWCTAIAAGKPSWTTIGGSGGGTQTPTDPGTTPTDPGGGGVTPPAADTSTPSPTVRPFAVLLQDGTWSTPAGVTLAAALSDGDTLTSATGQPTIGTGGVRLVLDMRNFQHTSTSGNDLIVTLFGARSSTAGTVQARLVSGNQVWCAAVSKSTTTSAQTLTFTWPAASQSVIPSWQGVEVEIIKTAGDLTLTDVMLQSSPVAVTPPPGTDTTDPATLRFATNSMFYSDLSSAPLAKASAGLVTYLRTQVGTATGAALRLDAYQDSCPMWMATASTPRVNITPPTTSTRGDVALMHNTAGTGALDGVPIPSGMTPPSNLFKTAAIVSLDTKQVWEFLGLTQATDGTWKWSASWGGRIDSAGTSNGAFPTGTGFTGSGISFVAAAIKVSEAKLAVTQSNVNAIGHAIGLNLAYDTASSGFVWPATRSDGKSTDANAPKMGQRYRLKASADLSGCTPLGKAVGTAMKKYGLVVVGGAEKAGLICESGSREQAQTGTDPWGAILQGRSVDTVLQGLPLDQLEAVSPGWGGPAWVPEPDTTTPTTPTNPTNPPTQSAAMRILGPTRSGLPWHVGAHTCNWPMNAAAAADMEAWMGFPLDGFVTYSARDGGQSGLVEDWPAGLTNGYKGRLIFGYTPLSKAAGNDWAGVASGKYDSIARDTANYLVRYGRGNSIIRLTWEIQIDWTWKVTTSNVANFKAGFRRHAQIFKSISKDFVICFEVNSDNGLSGSSAANGVLSIPYPGDDVVDLIGLDIYEFKDAGGGTCPTNKNLYRRRTSGSGVMLDNVAEFARAHGKGMCINEWGCHGTQGCGDSPAFIQFMFDWMWANRDVVAVEAYFHENMDYIQNALRIAGGGSQMPNAAAKYKALWNGARGKV